MPAIASAEAGFLQTNLRTRVSWVEVIDKNSTDTVASYYSYDIHGNVKSLQQNIPGLDAKRTDYVYDLVSGKVNYVVYQFDRPDQYLDIRQRRVCVFARLLQSGLQTNQ